MGKSKIKIQKIEKESNRRVTFNKRRIGLLKKAYEISILCDVDIALIFFSPNNEMTCFEGPRSSVEEVVMKFANTSEHERAKSHIQKYTAFEDQLRNTMPRKIENEKTFQEVARKLYQSHPRLTSLSEFNRSTQMNSLYRPRAEEVNEEIRDIQRFIGLYDLNVPIGDLISSGKEATQMELYIQRQLQKLQNFKQMPHIMSSQIPASWLDSQKDKRTYGQNENFESICIKQEAHEDVEMENVILNSLTYGKNENFESICIKQEAREDDKTENVMLNSLKKHIAESTYMNKELDASIADYNTQILSAWDNFFSDMGILLSGVNTDQIHPTILPELSESDSDLLPSSIEDDINAHDFLEDISAFEHEMYIEK